MRLFSMPLFLSLRVPCFFVLDKSQELVLNDLISDLVQTIKNGMKKKRANDGTRTRDFWIHNPTL